MCLAIDGTGAVQKAFSSSISSANNPKSSSALESFPVDKNEVHRSICITWLASNLTLNSQPGIFENFQDNSCRFSTLGKSLVNVALVSFDERIIVLPPYISLYWNYELCRNRWITD